MGDLEDGTWIFSSKLLCSPNFRVSPRKLEDIGMHLRVREPLQGTVSWTDKPMPYFVHQVDRSKWDDYLKGGDNPRDPGSIDNLSESSWEDMTDTSGESLEVSAEDSGVGDEDP